MDGKRIRAGQVPSAAAYLPAVVALCIILFAGFFADRQSRTMANLGERAAVRARMEMVAGAFVNRVDLEASAADRLAGALAVQPAADLRALERLVADLLPGYPVRGIAALAGAGAPLVLGDGAEALAALLADPPQGSGTRFVRTPEGTWLAVWSRMAGPEWRGAVVVSPMFEILAAAGLTPDLGLAVLLDDGESWPVLGDAAAVGPYPVRVPVAVRGADLTLAAAPGGGWTMGSTATWPIWIVTALAVGLIVGPMMRTRRLIEERQSNILELRDREADLGRLSRRLGLALDASKVGVWDFNIDTDLLVWDERMDELYGYPRVVGRRHTYADWRNRLHPEDLPRAEEEFREAIEETGRYVSNYRLLLPDGAVRHVRAIGAVYRETDGNSKIVGVNWDVTVDVVRNEELNAKRLEAEGASVAKSQFLATMSHEIRTPMNGVIGMLDLILRTELDPTQRERAAIACDSARQLLDILNDILDLSKLEANRIALDPALVDVRRLARDVVALMASGASERDLEVTAVTDAELPALVTCDASRFRQVLMNLVGNAVKFTETGSVVTSVGYDVSRGRLQVAVRDTGVGIAEDAKRDLFQRFVQVDSSITRRRGGTGLGLAISRQLVELMGGEITVDSVDGLGSTFRFWIPAPAAEATAEPIRPALESEIACVSAPAADLPPVRVLVAEDNPTNRQLLAAYLAMAGHSAHMVTNGHEAVLALAEEEFDLVIMDIQMPVMDGITAAGRIRALEGPKAAIPIIALTANAMEGDREYCLAAGMSEYVTKPVSLEALYLAMIRSLDYSPSVSSTWDQPSPGSKLSMAAAIDSVSSPRSAS